MKNLAFTLIIIVMVACGVGFVAYRATGNAPVAEALSKQDAMEWLRADFQLSEAQFAAIKKLHDSYSVVCEEHCRAIQDATRTRNKLKSGPNSDPAALAAAERHVEELRLVCESAIATHVRRCAAEMNPDAAERYLALVLPKIKDFDHQAAPDVRVTNHKH